MLSLLAFGLAASIMPAAECPTSKRWHVMRQWGRMADPDSDWEMGDVNVIRFRAGRPQFNRSPVSDARLLKDARSIARQRDLSTLIVDAYRTDCALIQRYTHLIEAAADCVPTSCVVSIGPAPSDRKRGRGQR